MSYFRVLLLIKTLNCLLTSEELTLDERVRLTPRFYLNELLSAVELRH